MSKRSKDVGDAKAAFATSAVGALAGVAMGAGPVPATIVGGVLPPALTLAHKLYQRALTARQDRAGRTLEHAAEILDVGLDILQERVLSHDDRVELLARVLEASARTPLDEKVRALGKVLASGLADDGDTDEALLLAAALEDIEAPHIMVLNHLVKHPNTPAELQRPRQQSSRGWEATQLESQLPNLSGFLGGVLAVLAGKGLITEEYDAVLMGSGGPGRWIATALGERCVYLLDRGGPEPE